MIKWFLHLLTHTEESIFVTVALLAVKALWYKFSGSTQAWTGKELYKMPAISAWHKSLDSWKAVEVTKWHWQMTLPSSWWCHPGNGERLSGPCPCPSKSVSERLVRNCCIVEVSDTDLSRLKWLLWNHEQESAECEILKPCYHHFLGTELVP